MTLLDSGAFVVYNEDDPNLYKVRPDLYIAFDVNVELVRRRRNYFVYEVGKPPEFALEVASPNTRRRDVGPKRDIYADIGIREYWRFDPTGGELYGYPLAGDALVDGAYQSIALTQEDDGMLWGYSEALDLCLCAQGPRLMYYDRKTGEYLHNIAEENAARVAAEAERDQVAAGVTRAWPRRSDCGRNCAACVGNSPAGKRPMSDTVRLKRESGWISLVNDNMSGLQG